MKLFLIAISLVLLSCNSQKKATMKDDKTEQSESGSGLELIMQEEQGGFEADEMLVFRDAKRLKSFFSKINRTRKPGLPVPDIDFLKEIIIIQCTEKESLTDSASLSVLKETATQFILNIQNRSEAKNTLNANSYGSFSIYKMPITAKDIILEKQLK